MRTQFSIWNIRFANEQLDRRVCKQKKIPEASSMSNEVNG